MFVDQVTVTLKAGKGGDGCVSFRREARVPKGGPDGGHGGDGGSIAFAADENISSLAYFRFYPITKAKNGGPGEGGNRTGKRGPEVRLGVPVGTVVKDEDGGAVLADLGRARPDLPRGPGRAAADAATRPTRPRPTRRPASRSPAAPARRSSSSWSSSSSPTSAWSAFPTPGNRRSSRASRRPGRSSPTIPSRPWPPTSASSTSANTAPSSSPTSPGSSRAPTSARGWASASSATSSGRSSSSTSSMSRRIPGRDPLEDYQVIMKELEAFSPEVAARPQILAANKVDLLGDDRSRLVRLKRLAARRKIPFFAVSALKREGLRPLVGALARDCSRRTSAAEGRETRPPDGDDRPLRRDLRSHPSRPPAGRRRGPPPDPARPHPLHPLLPAAAQSDRARTAPAADRLRMVELACRRRAGVRGFARSRWRRAGNPTPS